MKRKPEEDFEKMEQDAKTNPAVRRMLLRKYGEKNND